ncbi:hypothetical protein [Treponema endosymbiont of Eucomonympha sp.]|uniref:hypothetical protein n=1 Tax=Treponema endosymbiont of Eucomonympha sp. TaxID=1580831 RepID=UPI000750A985|nr:hypothetical protein [Treponema endosymbiont of Eucomonympha sp.]
MSSERWLTNLPIEGLKEKAARKPDEPFATGGISVYKNQKEELLPGEIFKPHPDKSVEASNYGRIRYENKILEQKPDPRPEKRYRIFMG